MMRLWIDPSGSGGARFEFDRGDSDFSQRDRAVLDLLLPHLRQLRRRAAVLGVVAEGATNGEVASLLGISSETVRKHLENAYAKLGVHTRTGAVAAVLNGGKESM
jgi:DNA-binding NarL/FixJ family response regulator